MLHTWRYSFFFLSGGLHYSIKRSKSALDPLQLRSRIKLKLTIHSFIKPNQTLAHVHVHANAHAHTPSGRGTQFQFDGSRHLANTCPLTLGDTSETNTTVTTTHCRPVISSRNTQNSLCLPLLPCLCAGFVSREKWKVEKEIGEKG